LIKAVNSQLTRNDYERFLIRLYFNKIAFTKPLKACIDRAYLDLNRTLRHISKFPSAQTIREKATYYLLAELEHIRDIAQSTDQGKFDAWHKKVSLSVKEIYRSSGWNCFYIGQSQKWLNMSIKYAFTLGESYIPGFQPLYGYCHVPIDNIIIQALQRYGFQGFRDSWSRVDSYEDYFERQQWIRARFRIAPLDVEFRLWADPQIDIPRRCGPSEDPNV
jgi:hypothetical protein